MTNRFLASFRMVKGFAPLVVALVMGLGISNVQALHFEPNEGFTVDFDTTLTYGAMWRVEGQKQSLMVPTEAPGYFGVSCNVPGGCRGLPYNFANYNINGPSNDNHYIQQVLNWNSDDGDRNFKKGDMVSNRFSAISDIDFRYNNKGLFLRTQLFYDSVYFEQNSWTGYGWDWWGKYGATPNKQAGPVCWNATIVAYNGCGTYAGPESINNLVASRQISDPRDFSEHAKDTMGKRARFLDSYVYGNFPIGDHTLDLRIGRQAISWGESLMLQGGIGFAQNRINAAAATAPGVELKEIFLPTGAVYGQIDLTSSLTMEAYWQYEWLPSELMADGSYFSAQDMLDKGSVMLLNVNVRNNCMFGFKYYGAPGGTTGTHACWAPIEWTTSAHTTLKPGFGYEQVIDSNAMYQYPSVLPQHPADQGGVAFRYLLEDGSEVGAYALQYHDHYPSLWASNRGAIQSLHSLAIGSGINGMNFDGMNTNWYTIEYMDYLKLLGLTYNTVIHDIQTGFEVAYRPNQPVVPACNLDQMENQTGLPGNGVWTPTTGTYGEFVANMHTTCRDPSLKWIAAKGAYDNTIPDSGKNWSMNAPQNLFAWPIQVPVYTYNVGITAVVPPTFLWDTGIFVAEYGGWYVSSLQNYDLKNTSIGGFTKEGDGISFIFLPQYKNVMEGVDLTIPFFVNYTLNGSFAYYNYSEKALWTSIGLEAIYLSNTTFGVTYNVYGGNNSMWQDRDNVSFNVKYTF